MGRRSARQLSHHQPHCRVHEHPRAPGTFSVVELLPFTRTDVASVVSTWGLRADLTERVRAQIKDPSLAKMARIPLLTALLCAAAESDAEELPAYQAGIYERVLRRFLAQENRWPQTPEAEATEIDQLIGLLAPIAFHFAAQPEGWTDRMPANQITDVMRSVGPIFTELGRDAATILRDLSVRAGVSHSGGRCSTGVATAVPVPAPDLRRVSDRLARGVAATRQLAEHRGRASVVRSGLAADARRAWRGVRPAGQVSRSGSPDPSSTRPAT